MILQKVTEKELLETIEKLSVTLFNYQTQLKAMDKKLVDMQKKLDKKPDKVVTKTIVKEIEKPVINEVKTIEIDKSVLASVKKLTDRIKALEDKKPEKQIVKEIQKVQIDSSIMPTIKKLSDRMTIIESKKPEKQIIKELTTHEVKTVDSVSKKQLAEIKKMVSEIKPIINNVIQGVTDQDVIKLIDSRVTINYVNKLYKKG